MLQPERDDTIDTTTTERANDRGTTLDRGATTDGTPTTTDGTPTTAGGSATSTADLAGMQTSDRETTPEMPLGPDGDTRRPLLGEDDLASYRSRWDAVQVRFVDQPRDSVKEADALVADLMQRLAQTFAEERASLERQWEQGTDVGTEELRIAMQRYRSFFDRLLAA